MHAISLFMTVVYSLPVHLKRFLGALGIWIWFCVFLSFTFYDTSPTAPTEWMLVMPVILEFLLLTERVSKNKNEHSNLANGKLDYFVLRNPFCYSTIPNKEIIPSRRRKDGKSNCTKQEAF